MSIQFFAAVAPAGTSALFVEVSVRADQQISVEEITRQSIESLKKSGILREDDKVSTVFPVLLPCAYVIYDSARAKTVAAVHKALNKKGIYSFGRYGSWIYSSMEDAVLQGKEYASRLLESNVSN